MSEQAAPFALEVGGLRVECVGWPGALPSFYEPFLGRARPDWSVRFRAEADAVTIDRHRRRVTAPTERPTRGVVAGFCLAAEDAKDAVVLHAAACRRGDQALLLVAPSGGGKSTLATLLEGWDLLSDESILVRRGRSGPVAFGTPLWSDCPRSPKPIEAPLGAVLFLAKSHGNRLEPLPPSRAVEALMPAVFAAPGTEGRAVLARVWRTFAGLPAYRFAFRHDSSCLAAIDRLGVARCA